MRYLINLSYNGSLFYGYQIQNNKVTVEGEIEKTLSKILNTKINTIAASRTDRGVHALNQYCHFDYDKSINLKKLTHSMNSLINDGIYIRKITKVNDDFHARYNVVQKEYIYKINMGEYNPIEKDYVYQYNKPIKKELIEEFIKLMNGEHNFKSFTSDKDKDSYVDFYNFYVIFTLEAGIRERVSPFWRTVLPRTSASLARILRQAQNTFRVRQRA